MKLAGRKVLVAGAATVVAAAGIVAAFSDFIEGALAALILLVLLTVALQLQALRRVEWRQQSLDRLEQKLDVVARRVVTEAEATGRELGGRIDSHSVIAMDHDRHAVIVDRDDLDVPSGHVGMRPVDHEALVARTADGER